MTIINGSEWQRPSDEHIAQSVAEYTRTVTECMWAVGMTDAEIAVLDARADRVRALDRLSNTPPELRSPAMYAAAGLDYDAEIAADDAGSDDAPDCAEPDAGGDLPNGPTTPAADFRAWRERMGWSQAEAAAALDLSRRSIIGYEQGAQAIPRTVALACWALTIALRR